MKLFESKKMSKLTEAGKAMQVLKDYPSLLSKPAFVTITLESRLRGDKDIWYATVSCTIPAEQWDKNEMSYDEYKKTLPNKPDQARYARYYGGTVFPKPYGEWGVAMEYNAYNLAQKIVDGSTSFSTSSGMTIDQLWNGTEEDAMKVASVLKASGFKKVGKKYTKQFDSPAELDAWTEKVKF